MTHSIPTLLSSDLDPRRLVPQRRRLLLLHAGQRALRSGFPLLRRAHGLLPQPAGGDLLLRRSLPADPPTPADGALRHHRRRTLPRDPAPRPAPRPPPPSQGRPRRSEEHTSELQSLMSISYAVFCLTKK